MSFHRRHIPEIDKLKKIYKECKDDKEFLELVIGRADATSGSTESMNFLTAVQNKVYPRKPSWEDLSAIAPPEKWIEMYKHYQELISCNNETE